MNAQQPFLDDIRTHPDEDRLRLIFADWLEDNGDSDRAEFVRAMIRAAQQGEHDPDWAPLLSRAETLLQLHWEEWVAPLRPFVPNPPTWYDENWINGGYDRRALAFFWRGFVTRMTLRAETLLSRGEELFRIAPVHSLRLLDARSLTRELAGCPLLRKLDSLAFLDRYRDPLSARDFQPLTSSPHLEQLRSLDLGNHNLGDEGLGYLLDAPWFEGLHELLIWDNGLSPDGFAHLLARPAFQPRVLDLGSNALGDDLLGALGEAGMLMKTHDLRVAICQLTGATFSDRLLQANLGAIRLLDLAGNRLECRGLRRLLLGANWVTRLRSLRLSRCGLEDEAADLLAGVPALPALTELEVSGNAFTPAGRAKLRARFNTPGFCLTLEEDSA